jgi:Amt family ammonium transporter
MKSWIKTGLVALGAAAIPAAGLCAEAQGAAPATAAAVAAVQKNLDIVWTLLGGVLVFVMQAGFAMLETGCCRAKNASNIMMKNLFDFVLGSLVFYAVGYGLMFGVTKAGIIGTTGWFMPVTGGESSWDWTFMFFQTMFCATSATIVSGAMAERTKFKAYLVYSALVSLFIYPIFGKWAWGNLAGAASAGWLSKLPTGAFCDFAGSTVVHSIGGWLALAGAIVVGPRLGKFGPDGKPHAFLGHNLVYAELGVFILWIGWFGFNPGSTCMGVGSIGRIAMTTNLSAVAGTFTAMCAAWILFGKPEMTMCLNGSLAGLVAITAGCNTVSLAGSVWIGAIGGVLVVLSCLFVERVLKIDDPVGAVSVHCANGVWGTLACGLFNAEAVIGTASKSTGLFYGGGCNQLISQLIGAGTAAVWAFGIGFCVFELIKHTVGLRATREEELKGLDITEHGNDCYAGFQIFSNQ